MRATLAKRFAEYGDYHQSVGNKMTHLVGIPVIALALLGLGSKVSLFGIPVDLGMVLAVVLIAVYLGWHVGLALGMAALFVPLYLVGREIPALALWGILAAGVALQYVGHFFFERNSPAFHKNALHMLIGPLWVVALILGSLGLYRTPAARAPSSPN